MRKRWKQEAEKFLRKYFPKLSLGHLTHGIAICKCHILTLAKFRPKLGRDEKIAKNAEIFRIKRILKTPKLSKNIRSSKTQKKTGFSAMFQIFESDILLKWTFFYHFSVNCFFVSAFGRYKLLRKGFFPELKKALLLIKSIFCIFSREANGFVIFRVPKTSQEILLLAKNSMLTDCFVDSIRNK